VATSPPTALSTVLRRISHEPRERVAAPEAPASGAAGVELVGFDEPVETVPEPAPEPAPEDIAVLLAEQPEVARLGDVEPETVEERAVASKPPRRRPEITIAPLSGRVGLAAPRPVRPDTSRQSSEPPSPATPVEPPDDPEPALLPGAAAERLGRQPLSRNRRLYRRVRLGAEIEIDRVPCSLIDVSIGGFAATGAADLAANKIVPVLIGMNIDGIEVATRVSARIVYAHRERLSGRFIDLTPSQIAFLRYLVTWRGESVGMIGTTTLLDAITGAADHGHVAKLPNGSRDRWWAGLLGWKVNPPR